jgi:uncharacterized Zn-binding protein involved in type VI secretion
MANAARKGDTDNFGHTIASAVSDSVRIDGAYVATQGSTMDDGVAITSGTIDTVRFNGQPAAVVGSTTAPHTQDPGKNQSGTIQVGASDVNISG